MRQLSHLAIFATIILSSTAFVSAAEKTKTVTAKDIKLTVPTTWKQGELSNNLRTAQFEIPAVEGDKDAAELVVYFFGGAGGGVNANLQRWAGQFQSSGKKQKTSEGKSTQGKYYLIDITGVYNKPIGPPIQRKTNPTAGYQMLGVVLVVKDKGNYFLKLTGPQKTVSHWASTLRTSFGADIKDEKEAELDQ
ncbi:MAG: hypothetical protein VX761_03555 [Planctomycetota bacterium]|nr:hypothetical protein [Planctomycetota bacterium]